MSVIFSKQDFQHDFNVSHETMEKLEIYEAILRQWQARINLIGNSTLNQIWHRHFYDSAQLLSYCNPDINQIIDLGSGAGLPAIIMAILKPELSYHLIESDQRKAIFLNQVAKAIFPDKSPITIHNQRIENIKFSFNSGRSLITARALSTLESLLTYCELIENRAFKDTEVGQLELLFLKGKSLQSELTNANKAWYIIYNIYQSKTDIDANILSIKEFRRGQIK